MDEMALGQGVVGALHFYPVSIIAPMFSTHAHQILLLVAGQEGRGLGTDTKQRSLCSRESFGEVDVHFFMLDSSACTGFSSSNSVFVRAVTYHQGCLLFFIFVLLLSEG